MKSNLRNVSLALLSAVFVLGCQDQGTGVVESDGAGPQFAKKKRGKSDKPGGGGGVKGTVTLAGGMINTTGLQLPGKIDATTVTLNTNNFDGDIVMNFAGQNCQVIVGQNGRNGAALDPDEMDFLLGQVTKTFTGGWFFLEVDKTSLTVDDPPKAGNHLLSVGHYDTLDSHRVSIDIRLWPDLSGVEGVKVKWVSPDVFEFTGPIWVIAGGVDGRKGKRGRRAIACGAGGDNLVTVTAVPI